MKDKNADRRSFLKNAAVLGMGIPGALSLSSNANASEINGALGFTSNSNPTTFDKHSSNEFSIFITTDLHAQIHTHDEFFWEQGKAVYKKRGGLAVLKTMIDQLRTKYPQNILYDGGDYFHGHGVASLSEGEALIPLMNAFNYDLILPGNWEVVYKKKKCSMIWGILTLQKFVPICGIKQMMQTMGR